MAKYDEHHTLPKGLLLCNYKPNQGAVTVESINTFLNQCKYPLFPYSMDPEFDATFSYEKFDFIIIHDSIIPNLGGYIKEPVRERLRDFKGPIFQFIQDPYRSTEAMQDFILDVGVEAVFTVYPVKTAKVIFNRLKSQKFFHYLTGYASHNLNMEKTVPLSDRKVFLGYRGREYPYWFGETINIKVQLAKRLKKELSRFSVKTDISTREKDRLYGRDWVKFLSSCRAIYATESDISFTDPTGQVAPWYSALEGLNKTKGSNKKWDGSFVLDDPFFTEYAKFAPTGVNVIPPRVFETICLRTACILTEGDYSGILHPWRHYVPLKADLSNLEEVVEFVKDDKKLSLMVATAFSEIANNRKYTWRGYADFLDESFESLLAKINPRPFDQLLPLSKLRELTGPIFLTDNPHAMTIINPKNTVLSYQVKQRSRSVWRRVLARIRKATSQS